LKNKRYIISVGLITTLILTAGGFIWNSGTNELSSSIVPSVSPWYQGEEGALVSIDMYTDFECSTCLKKERQALQAYYDFPGKIRLACHHFPGSENSIKIAEALEAAGEQGRFWEMHDRLIDDIPCDIAVLIAAVESTVTDIREFTIAHLVSEAAELGLDMEKFNKALESGRFNEKVQMAKQDGISSGVQTVSLFINGKEFRAIRGTLDEFYAAITAELERLEKDADN
jgi:predicted DsbA family dithiol-disulfide isomerase